MPTPCNSPVLTMAVTPIRQTQVATQQADQERLVGAIAQRLRHTLRLNKLVHLAAQTLGELLEVDWVEIVQYLPQLSTWRQVAEYYRHLNTVSSRHQDIPDADNPYRSRLRQFKVVQGRHHRSIPEQPTADLPSLVCGNKLVMPLKTNGLWGYLSLMRDRPHHWTASEIALIQAAVEQICAGIEHAQQYEQLQQLNNELEHTVVKRTQQLSQVLAHESVLKRITDKIRGSLDETHILAVIVAELVTFLELESCHAGRYDDHGQTCTIAYSYPRNPVSPLAFPAGNVIDMTTSEPEVYRQLLKGHSVQFSRHTSELPGSQLRHTVLVYPIVDHQGVLGDLWLFRSDNQAFNELEVRLVQQVTNYCAIAIRQVRSYQIAQDQVEALEYINQLKDSFLSTVSHELRTPISTIKMAIQMLTLALGREGLLPDPSKPSLSANKIAHYLKILNDECNREIGLITDLLDMQQLEAGTHTPTIQLIELSSYLHRILRPFQEQAIAQGQILDVAIAHDLPCVQSDPQSLERIVVELLTNACKYSPAGEFIQLSAKVISLDERRLNEFHEKPHHTNWAHAPTHLVQIAVANSGVEIAPNHLRQIFDKFYRIPSHDPHRHSGTGLGLALVQKLALRIGAKVFAESGQGQTCFTLELLPG